MKTRKVSTVIGALDISRVHDRMLFNATQRRTNGGVRACRRCYRVRPLAAFPDDAPVYSPCCLYCE